MAMSMGAAKRGKPRIRPPKKIGPDTSIKDTWAKLATAIREIQNHNASKLSFEEHYRYAYNLVLFKHGDQLYSGVQTLIVQHLDRLAEEKIVPTFPRSGGTRGAGKLGGGAEAIERATEGDRFLKAVKGVWEDHTGSMRKLKDVLKYMDKVHAPTANVPPVYELGLSLFLTHIIRQPTIHTHLISTLLSQVQLEREGFTITRSTVRECIDILLRLHVPEREGGASVYQQDFEPEFLRRSGEWYEYEAGEELAKSDASLYLSNVSRRLAEEHDRTIHYLSPSTLPHLQSLLISSLLTPHLSTILNMPGSGLVQMVDKDRYGDLKRLYALFGKVPADEGVGALKKAVAVDIDVRGKAVNAGTADVDPALQDTTTPPAKPKSTPPLTLALQWVHAILLLFDKYTLILSSSFSSSLALQSTINSSFQNVINAHPRAPEFLSLYIDETLKKGKGAKGVGGAAKGVTEEEVEEAKEKTIRIFRFLTDKDKFERYYKNHLARRLLSGKSVGGDAEQEMVGRLKKEVGFQFTHRLEGMFTDMRLSDEAANIFGNDPRYNIPFTLHVSVLTSSNWPPSTLLSLPLTFPPPLLPALEHYQTFYDSRHSGRRLTWQGLLGSADLKVRTRKGQWEVNLSTMGMVVLLAFADLKPGDILSYDELKAQTSLPDAELARTLQSLACGKHRLLVKHPKGREVERDNTFEFNEAFSSPLARIKILQISSASASTSASSAGAGGGGVGAGGQVENAQEREETERQIEEERKHQVEACIVRIMKDRKTMRHNDLVSEVAHQLAKRFVAGVPMIKKRIEGLIDREYLERTEDMGSYRYLA
ncbi:Cullin 3 [Cryptococcus neoformans c8]|nr:Cullin 3 [Cryptococcus neoformans var. grubii AD1-83a]OXG55676.1 Cullin 3 [Cryptococcus neoformans var. grubii MW-RSA1955]OXG59703.1 Cullin 3 [Cryptococcus neoformans var. grubii CHC193]OXG61322.1 Cullin 3 [Cryptococcus neoformans var. grubii c8]OXG77529.1 Cullin 3 [Cryptococcus neoformans var. grubii MW-RSA36]OXH07595.1 Cullin 3 [Cryptococcus neoformans var. grubii A5-35-17]OXH08987.1 Cullin 3 [Cryptococcus neoformans var. grubii A1-35-8]OXL07195.1 Cullin 3 [Cryptococcus neoformans var. 